MITLANYKIHQGLLRKRGESILEVVLTVKARNCPETDSSSEGVARKGQGEGRPPQTVVTG